MSKADEYRQFANDCIAWARIAISDDQREQFLEHRVCTFAIRTAPSGILLHRSLFCAGSVVGAHTPTRTRLQQGFAIDETGSRSSCTAAKRKARMSALGQKQTSRLLRAMSALAEVADLHSITWSACASSVGGTVRPSVLAVVRLKISSKRVGCSTGSPQSAHPSHDQSWIAPRERQSVGAVPGVDQGIIGFLNPIG